MTPGVTIGSSWGENVITWPSLVVNDSRAGNAASASTILGAAVVDAWSVDAVSLNPNSVDAEGDWIGADASPDCDAAAAPHEQSSNVKAIVVFMHV